MSRILPVVTQETKAMMMMRSVHKLTKPSLTASSDRRANGPRPTPENPLILSTSEISDFLRCRVKHHWGYQCKLEPVTSRIPLVMGSKGHMILDQWYTLPYEKRTPLRIKNISKRVIAATSVMELPEYDKELLQAMTVGYAEHYLNVDTDYNDHMIGIRDAFPDHWFVLPLVPDRSILIRGKLDVGFQPVGMKSTMATLESKFKKTISFDGIENMLQLTVYLWAMRVMFPKMKRFIVYYQILRKQRPTARVKTALFYREPVERDADEIDQWVKDAGRQVLDILDGAVYPSPMDSCSWSCDFKIPCLLRGDAGQLKHVLTTEFQERKYK